jgi:hypothetical protein
MTDVPPVGRVPGPDADLLECILVTVPGPERLDGVVEAVAGLVRSGAIRLIDVLLLHRGGRQASVRARERDEVEQLAALAVVADDGVRLSAHDVDLAAVTVEPGVSALLLLVEDRWAAALAAAAREVHGRVVGGERVGRDRFRAAVGRSVGGTGRQGTGNLLVRGLATSDLPEQAVDPAAQVRTLVELVERGVLTFEQYETQRRRVIDG